MVLEQTTKWSSAVSEDSVQSDADRYANISSSPSQDHGPSQYRLELGKLPQPIPILAPLFGFTQRKLVNLITMDASRCKALVDRPLTQQEFDAISYHCAKLNAISSYGGPIGILGGVWRAQNSKDTFRFPFWQPTYKANERVEEGMFDPKKFGPLRGMQAEAAWHALRRMAYALVGGSVGLAVVGAYATSVAVAGQRTDIRMKDFMATLKGMTPEERRFRVEQGAKEGRRSLQGEQQPDHRSSQPFSAPIDSRTGGEESPRASSQSENSRLQQDRRQSNFQSSGFDFDDASPQGSSPESEPAVDSWERLRRNARNGVSYQDGKRLDSEKAWENMARSTTNDSTNESRSASSLADSFSFSKNDEERELAKSEAQKDFDSRIERERQGQDFASDGKDRWN